MLLFYDIFCIGWCQVFSQSVIPAQAGTFLMSLLIILIDYFFLTTEYSKMMGKETIVSYGFNDHIALT